ncbi:hypothetical protein [Streptococcus sciuri]|uniref:Uncharacterized protein n=1 Tax=Streptococcus sciuri TaxID=2973939 RepID=A0ABT2F8K1_9STRE|nr:hypothetical protein [Streptococcus sciuri]MCS4488807.1 hypothetical protein [Streptococcus sciuri]
MMIFMTMKSGKLSMEDYRKTIQQVMVLLSVLVMVFVVLLYKLSLDSFNSGFVLGLIIGLVSCIIRSFYMLRSAKSLKASYIKVMDERNKYLTQLTVKIIYSLLVLVVIVLLLCHHLLAFDISYETLLYSFLGLIFYGFIGVRFIVERVY